ncbi:unnamed protein product [Fasciola hepatica]|uniref:SWIM-type domain-containing protein n=1 Tax=Fasciola hepatica TaxID=6192 RepID=A0ABC9HH41_FASHE
MKTGSICEVITEAIWKMDWQWEIGYIGCQVEFQVNWNGTIKVFFFLKEMGTDFREECLLASATNFNRLIQQELQLIDTRFSEVIITKRAAIKRDAVVYRRAFQYTFSIWEEMMQYTTIKRISVKNQTRLKFTCSCGDAHNGRTDRCLTQRVSEHIPKWLSNLMTQPAGAIHNDVKPPASSIGRHLIASGHKIDLTQCFKVLLSNPTPKLLAFSEAFLIMMHQPALCAQKRLTQNVCLPWR